MTTASTADRVEASQAPSTVVERLHESFRSPDPAARPMMRWWWFGPDVQREDLLRDLDDMAAAGIGGVECAFVYPMGPTSDRFLSPSFLADVGFAAEAAEQRSLRFDLTLGSGWPYGGPHIDESTASRRLHWQSEQLSMHAQRIPLPLAWKGEEFVGAFIGDGTHQEVPARYEPLEASGGYLEIPDGVGPRVLLVASSRLSGQSVKRASAGAEGWVLDHLSAEATRAHIEAVAEPLVAAAGAARIGTVFCDSLEVYDAGWTPALPAEFAARRGYDVLPQLWKLTLTGELGRDVRADFHRTQTELAEENFVGVMRDWARTKGLVFRVQGYGQPPVTVSSYRYADAFEGEGWGWNVVTACRWASSAGQYYGQETISSETWTWNHSPSFRSTPLDILGETHDHLLMGINHFIGHGWPTSPRPEAETGSGVDGGQAELGRVFYASGAFDSRNAWWEAAPRLWGTIHRLSWLMRQGTRLSQVGVYVPARDIYAGFAAAGRIDLYKEARLHIGDELPQVIRTAGLDFDLFDDDAVAVAESSLTPERFPVVVLPYATDVPEHTRVWLNQVLDAGGTVLDLGGSAGIGLTVDDVAEMSGHAFGQPGAAPVRLAGFDPLSGEPLPNRTVAVTTRELVADVGSSVENGSDASATIHFAANTGAAPAEVEIELLGADVPGAVVERWDPESGETVTVWREPGALQLHLEGYEAAVLIQHSEGAGQPPGRGSTADADAGGGETDKPVTVPGEQGAGTEDWQALELGEWTVQFPDEEVPRRVALPHRWEAEQARSHYSGSAVYTTTVAVPGGTRTAVLNLGPASPHELEDPEAAGLMEASFSAEVIPPVGVVARVIVDGQEAGFLWKTPYRMELSGHLSDGVHELQLEVFNVTSHRLAADTGIPRMVRQAEESFGRRFAIQTLDLALADVSSGLLKAPTLHVR